MILNMLRTRIIPVIQILLLNDEAHGLASRLYAVTGHFPAIVVGNGGELACLVGHVPLDESAFEGVALVALLSS